MLKKYNILVPPIDKNILDLIYLIAAKLQLQKNSDHVPEASGPLDEMLEVTLLPSVSASFRSLA